MAAVKTKDVKSNVSASSEVSLWMRQHAGGGSRRVQASDERTLPSVSVGSITCPSPCSTPFPCVFAIMLQFQQTRIDTIHCHFLLRLDHLTVRPSSTLSTFHLHTIPVRRADCLTHILSDDPSSRSNISLVAPSTSTFHTLSFPDITATNTSHLIHSPDQQGSDRRRRITFPRRPGSLDTLSFSPSITVARANTGRPITSQVDPQTFVVPSLYPSKFVWRYILPRERHSRPKIHRAQTGRRSKILAWLWR